jgi:hypothetical protein
VIQKSFIIHSIFEFYGRAEAGFNQLRVAAVRLYCLKARAFHPFPFRRKDTQARSSFGNNDGTALVHADKFTFLAIVIQSFQRCPSVELASVNFFRRSSVFFGFDNKG